MKSRRVECAEPRGSHSQRGAALVVAMLIVAMVTVMATSLAGEFLLTLRRSGNALLGEQSYGYLLGGEILAVKALAEDYRQNTGGADRRDDMSEFWAQELPPYELDDGWLLGKVSDLQGRFNLNALANRTSSEQRLQYTPEQQQFIRLLLTLEEPQLSSDQARAITESIMDWLDSDTEVNNFGAEDDYYFDIAPSYRAGNRLFSSIGELRAVANMDQSIYDAIAPHVMVWGGAVLKINIHTATDNVLRSLAGKDELSPLDDSDLQSLLASRDDAGFADLESFKELAVFVDRDMSEQWVSLVETTDYFLFTAEAEVAERRVRLYSVLHRDNSQVTALARSYIQPW